MEVFGVKVIGVLNIQQHSKLTDTINLLVSFELGIGVESTYIF